MNSSGSWHFGGRLISNNFLKIIVALRADMKYPTAMLDEIPQESVDETNGKQKRFHRIAALNVWWRIRPTRKTNRAKEVFAALINRPITDCESHSLTARLQQVKTTFYKWQWICHAWVCRLWDSAVRWVSYYGCLLMMRVCSFTSFAGAASSNRWIALSTAGFVTNP